MSNELPPIRIATRGSALALAQANQILGLCQQAMPERTFEIGIFKTTGDKLQTASLSNPGASLPKGLFTKELEVALLDGSADLAVHSLKDLPTELPDGLILGTTTEREDVRDVLIFARDRMGNFEGPLSELPEGATVGSSSNRRKAQLQLLRPDLNVVEIRGNVGTRLRKLSEQEELHATVLAAAGMKRLGFRIGDDGKLSGEDVPEGISVRPLSTEEMLPCVGQAAIGIETRAHDETITELCRRIGHIETLQCVTAERAFLRSMGGGCATPVAAYARIKDGNLSLRAVSFLGGDPARGVLVGKVEDADALGADMAKQLKS